MSEGAVFRTAQPATPAKESTPPPKGNPAGTATVRETDLFATYEQDQKKPYAAKYYGVENTWDKEPTLARDLKEIEGYVREQVTNKKVANETKAAEKFMRELERKAGLSTYENPNQRITKLLAYIDFKRVVDGTKRP